MTSLEGLPSTLESLYLCNSTVESLGTLPEGLRHLDLRYTDLTTIGDGLPQGLRFLAIGGSHLSELPTLPAGLVRLEVAETPEIPKAGVEIELGSGIVALAWTGGDKLSLPRALDGFDGIDTLVVEGTSIRQIDRLPAVSHLVLLNNEALEGFRLPADLRSLTLDELEHPVLGQALPKSLRALTLRRVAIRGADSWPISLRSLELVSATIQWGTAPSSLEELVLDHTALPPELPQGLRRLTIAGMDSLTDQERVKVGRDVRALADTLESLSLDQPQTDIDLSAFARLRELDVPGSFLAATDTLPDGLESLTLHGSIETLPELPASLRTLDLAECWDVAGNALDRVISASGLDTLILRRTDLAELASLPESLRVLDLSGTDVGELPSLPPSLTRLVLHLGQVSALGPTPESLRELAFVPMFPRTACPELALEVEPR